MIGNVLAVLALSGLVLPQRWRSSPAADGGVMTEEYPSEFDRVVIVIRRWGSS